MPSSVEQTARMPAASARWAGGRAEGMALLLVTACSWGLNWPLMKFLLTELPPFTMRTMSFALGLAFAVPLALARRESLRLPREQWLKLIIFATLNYGAFGVLTALSLWWLRASEAVVITYTLPIWAALLAWPILGERPTFGRAGGMVLALAGIAALLGADEIHASWAIAPGLASGFAAAFLFGLGTVVAKRQPLLMPPVAGVVWQLVFGAIPALVLASLEHASLSRLTPLAWLAFAYIAVMPMTIAYLTWFRALRLLPASIAATAVLISPLVGVLSSALLLGDPLGARQVAALAVTLTGVGLAART
jgi:probable blue pigment (indigoidine) exporter